MKSRKREEVLYGPIVKWFEDILRSKYKKYEIEVYDTHKEKLSKFLQRKGYHKYFSLFDTFEIQVDITAILRRKEEVGLAFIEVKSGYYNLKDVGQLLGYCHVAKPIIAIIISPYGPSKALKRLIQTYGRNEVLKYEENKYIKMVEWNERTQDIEYQSILPVGYHL